MIQIFRVKMWVFLKGTSLNRMKARGDVKPELLKNSVIYCKMQQNRHRKIIGSVLEMPIMVFVLAMKRSHSGLVTP